MTFSVKTKNTYAGMHEKFHYKTAENLHAQADILGVHIPMSRDTDILKEKMKFGNAEIQNRLGIAPMESASSQPDGSPSESTINRYCSYARGGAGLIWIEAVAISPESRNGIRQLMLTEANLDAFRHFVDRIREAGIQKNGFAPYLVIQAHHSGRYSAPEGIPMPLCAYHHLVQDQDLPSDKRNVVSDDYLRHVEEEFGDFARLARQAGFDAVDVKCCHGYLLPELTSAYLREGEYGGTFENRIRLLCNAVAASKVYESDTFQIASRIGIYDGLPYPYGFGVTENGDDTPDMTEPIRLMRILNEKYGVSAVNLTVGNPCVYKHINRPYDKGPYVPDEHPLYSMARIIHCIGEVKKAVPEITISASGSSYMRQFGGYYAAGAI